MIDRAARTRAFLVAGAATLGVAMGVPAATAATAPEGRAPYLKEADAICGAGNDALVDKAKQFEKFLIAQRKAAKTQRHKVAKPESVAEFTTKTALPAINEQLDRLSLLVPPAADRTTVEGFLKQARTIVAQVQKNPKNAAYSDPFSKLGKQMKSFGYSECFQARKQ